MSDSRLKPRSVTMSIDEYLAWEAQQEEKHELIDGLPVRRRLRMMAGGTVRHALIAMNIGAWLRPRLRSRRCAPYGSDLKVLSPTGAFRYPDVTVDCSPKTGRATFAQDPRVVMEVLSAANDTMAVTRLMHDYQAIETVTAIVFFSQDGAYAQVFARTDKGWRAEEARGLEVSIDLPGLDLTLPLAEVYEGVTFDDPPPPSD